MKPCAHCSGVINVTIEMLDHPALPEIPAATGTDVLTINILDRNDPPSIHLFDQDTSSLLEEDKSQPVMVSLDRSFSL